MLLLPELADGASDFSAVGTPSFLDDGSTADLSGPFYPTKPWSPSVEDMRFLSLAEHVSGWSPDPSTKTGAVLVDPRGNPVGLGCNRLPRGLKATPRRLNDRSVKYRCICHCERVAEIAAGTRTRGCVLYTWPFMSCATCASHMGEAGIVANVAPLSTNPRWLEEFELATENYLEMGVDVRLVDVGLLAAAGLRVPDEGAPKAA
jgi:dCMP deaminase